MDRVLADIKGDEVHVYIDDILMCTESIERHCEVLEEVLTRLKNANLCLKAKKCTRLAESVPFLGHVIDKKGVHRTRIR